MPSRGYRIRPVNRLSPLSDAYGGNPPYRASALGRVLAGFTYGAASPGWQASALRLIDLLMDGLKPGEPGARA